MSHNIDIVNGRATFAFRGGRKDIWHRLGNQHDDSWTVDDWARNSGLDWQATKEPAHVALPSDVDPEDYERTAGLFGIAEAMSREIMWENDVLFDT